MRNLRHKPSVFKYPVVCRVLSTCLAVLTIFVVEFWLLNFNVTGVSLILTKKSPKTILRINSGLTDCFIVSLFHCFIVHCFTVSLVTVFLTICVYGVFSCLFVVSVMSSFYIVSQLFTVFINSNQIPDEICISFFQNYCCWSLKGRAKKEKESSMWFSC